MSSLEDLFSSWAEGPGITEAEKCENAERAVKKAVAADDKLSSLDITVFAQGSYKARTNVKQDSDVDVCIRYDGAFFAQYPEGRTRDDFGNVASSIGFGEFKDMVGKALTSYFGVSGVTRGNKAFDVHENTYRIDADAVPTYEHRRYTGRYNPDRTHEYLSGVAFLPDKGSMIINWPDQNYENGVRRNNETGRIYKRVIRILKRLRNAMQEDKIAEADNVASFLIESLVWNAPLEAFQHDTYTDDVRHVIANIFNRTRSENECSEWREVNELKYLFRPSQAWTREQANRFLDAAWNYIGFK
jgi:hypothetical protein